MTLEEDKIKNEIGNKLYRLIDYDLYTYTINKIEVVEKDLTYITAKCDTNKYDLNIFISQDDIRHGKIKEMDIFFNKLKFGKFAFKKLSNKIDKHKKTINEIMEIIVK